MSDYLEDLYKQAVDGLELAGDDFNAEINIDCRNIITILDTIIRLKEDNAELVKSLRKADREVKKLKYNFNANSELLPESQYSIIIDKYEVK